MEEFFRLLRSRIFIGFLGILALVLIFTLMGSDKKEINKLLENVIKTQPLINDEKERSELSGIKLNELDMTQSELNDATDILVTMGQIAFSMGEFDNAEIYNFAAVKLLNQKTPEELKNKINKLSAKIADNEEILEKNKQLQKNKSGIEKQGQQVRLNIETNIVKEHLNIMVMAHMTIAHAALESSKFEKAKKEIRLASGLLHQYSPFELRLRIKNINKNIKAKNIKTYYKTLQHSAQIRKEELTILAIILLKISQASLDIGNTDEAGINLALLI